MKSLILLLVVGLVVAQTSPPTQPPTEQPKAQAQPRLKDNYLYRIPLSEDSPVNPPVETISKLESILQEATSERPADSPSSSTTQESTLSNKTAVNATEAPVPSFELPIPSRCPQITGTVEPDSKDSLMSMLETSSIPKAAQRGCRFFIMHELMQRGKQMHSGDEDLLHEAAHLNQTLQDCFKTCIQAYDNGTEVAKACQSGCAKTAAATEAVTKPVDDELEREDSQPDIHRSFSIIIPLRPMDPSMSPASGEQQVDGAPSMMPNALKMMLAMMHQMTERARAAMMHQGEAPASSDQDSQDGNSISVSRSMSVLVTKDQDGHSKMVVVHTLPRVQIHRFPAPSFFDDDDELPITFGGEDSKEHSPSSHSNSSTDDDTDSDDENLFDTDNLRIKMFGHLSRGGSLLGENGHGIHRQNHPKGEHKGEGSGQVYYYRSKLCYYLPRLFYLTLVILVLYVIFWLFCAVPTAFYRRDRRRDVSGGGVAIIASGDGKRKKFFFTKNQKYFQLNNKRLSTTSLPPPYPGEEDEAGPLPEKQPLPQDESPKTTEK